MSTIDEAKNHLMMTISFITSRSNDGAGTGAVSDSRGAIPPRRDDGKGEEGVVVDKADEDTDKGEKGPGIARRNSDSLKESPADKVADVVGVGKDACKDGRDAVRNDGFVLNKAVTDICIPKSGQEDTNQVGGAASKRGSTKVKGDPIAAMRVYHLRERRSAGGTIKKGSTIDRKNVARKFGKKSKKKNADILDEKVHEDLPASKKTSPASQTFCVDAKKSSGLFDDNLQLENDFSAHAGGATSEEIKCLGGNTQTLDAMNEDFSVMGDDWDELSTASMSDWHPSSLDEKFGAVDTFQSKSSKASADRITRDKTIVQTASKASVKTRSQEKVPASSSQSRADDDVAKQGIQDISIRGSNDVAPRQKDETARLLSTLSEGWTSVKVPRSGRATREKHYKSPKLKLEFKSLLRACEFDRMLLKHPEDEESAAIEYMHNVGGYEQLTSYVCDANKHIFLKKAEVPKQSEKEVPHQKGTSANHSPSAEQVGIPEESRLHATETDAPLLDSSAATDKSSHHGKQIWLCSRGWKSKKGRIRAHGGSSTQWFSPEFKIEFYSTKAADEFDEICQQYNGNEELAWGHYVRTLTKQSRKISDNVVGGRGALEAAKSRTLSPPEGMKCDKSLIVENDDECYICEDGGDLICCDYCEKSFHLDCHNPRLFQHQIRSDNWKCCECEAREMPLTRCGESKDCTSVPRQKCNNKRFAESEVLLCGGKRKEHEYPSNSVEVVHRNKKRKRAVASAVIEDRRPHGVASADGHHIIPQKDSECNLKIKQRKAVLTSRGWSSKPGYKHHYHWVSPMRKLEFVTFKAAEKFDDACQKCMGDEYKASILYTKRMKQQGHSIWHVVGGASALLSEIRASRKTKVENTSDGGELVGDILDQNGQLPKKAISNEIRDREDLLFSKGWTKVVASGQRIKRHHWVSPKLKIHFKSRTSAILFDRICQENNMDERFSLSSYTKKIKQSGHKVSRFILGGGITKGKVQERGLNIKQPMPKKGPRNRRNLSSLPHKGPRPQKPRIQESLGPGWTKRLVFFKTQWRSIYESPSLGIQFKFLRDANLFHSILQKNHGDEGQAWADYTRFKKNQKCPRNVINLSELNQSQTSADKNRKQNALTTSNRKKEKQRSKVPSSADTHLMLNTDITKKQGSQANSLLALLSCGWSEVHHNRRKGVVVHFKSPQNDVEFRSLEAAKSFDDVLRRNPNNETEALDDFVKENGMEKFRNMVYNFGTYTFQKTRQVKFNRSAKAAQNQCQSMTETLSEKSSVVSKSEGHIVDEDYWEVEKVVAQRYCNRRMEYLIRWKGCSSKDDTWEPAENLCDSAIQQAVMLPNLITNDPKFRDILQKVLTDAIALMKQIDREKVFHYPVTDEEAPEYSTIIEEPMCLSIMEEKVMDSLYKTIEEFTSDSMLMFSNCIKFNNSGPEGLWYRKEAERQRRLFRKEVYQIATEELENQLEFASTSQRNHMGSPKMKRTTKLKSVSCQKARSSGNIHKSSLRSAVAVPLNNPCVRRPTVERPKCSWTSLTPTDKIGSKEIYSIRTGRAKPSFFSHYFVRSLKMLQVPFGDETGEVEKRITEDGKIFELVSCKVPKKVAGSFRFSKQPDIEFLYVNTGENGKLMMNLQKELESLCSFGSLDKRKAIARLGHLQSEAIDIIDINSSDIEIIPEKGHEGCGFMPPNFFLDIKNCTCKTSDALQVRIISPKLGLIKGMLLVKSGIERIQIPESMIKVGPNKTSSSDWATVIIKKLYAPSAQNKLLGRLLDPNEDPPNSFKVEYQKSLSDMYQRILIGFGVPKRICDDYVKRSRNVDSLMHTHLMGVADPTGCIPYGEVFIPGYSTNVKANNAREIFGRCLKYGKVFISRSPCLEATDAKILSVLKCKPKQMSAKDWDNLCAYNFGTVIFGLPRSYDDAPIPSLIADGDLDGDLYFVLWDEEILGKLLHPKDCNSKKALRVLTKLEATDKSECHVNKISKLDKPYQKNWFLSAQNEMTDVKKIVLSTKLVGSLYRLCQTYSKKENGFFDIYDEDAIAFAQAYKDSMDVQKHGGKVYLPAHLHEALAPALRDFVTSH